jgi:hypothetical protein
MECGGPRQRIVDGGDGGMERLLRGGGGWGGGVWSDYYYFLALGGPLVVARGPKQLPGMPNGMQRLCI